MMVTVLIVALAATPTGSAPENSVPLARLASDLPAGWSVRVEGNELVLRRDEPVTSFGRMEVGNWLEPANDEDIMLRKLRAIERARAAAKETGTPTRVVLELRFQLEPRWTTAKHKGVKDGNLKIADAMNALHTKYRVFDILLPDGRNEEEAARLRELKAEQSHLRTALVEPPECDIGPYSVRFAGTFVQYDLVVQPESATAEYVRAEEVFRKHCRESGRTLALEIEEKVASAVRERLGLGPEVRLEFLVSDRFHLEGLTSVLVNPRIVGAKGVSYFVRGDDIWFAPEALEPIIRAYALGEQPRRLDELEWIVLLNNTEVAHCLLEDDLSHRDVPARVRRVLRDPSVEFRTGGGVDITCLSSKSANYAGPWERVNVTVAKGGKVEVIRRALP